MLLRAAHVRPPLQVNAYYPVRHAGLKAVQSTYRQLSASALVPEEFFNVRLSITLL